MLLNVVIEENFFLTQHQEAQGDSVFSRQLIRQVE